MSADHGSRDHSPPRCVIQSRDRALLSDIYLQRVLTRDQVIELGHFQSVGRCNARMKKLADQTYVDKLQFSARGSGSQAIWALGRRAVPIIADHLDIGLDEVARVASKVVSAALLEHTLGLTQVRIAFERSAAHHHRMRFRYLAECQCRHEYVALGRRWAIKPDAFVQWQTPTGLRRHFIELDLGHVGRDEFRRKCESYVEYAKSGAFRDVYAEPDFGVLVITTGARRLESLVKIADGASLRGVRFTTLAMFLGNDPLELQWQGPTGHGQLEVVLL